MKNGRKERTVCQKDANVKRVPARRVGPLPEGRRQNARKGARKGGLVLEG